MIAIALPWKIAIAATLMTIVLCAMWWAFSEGKSMQRTPTLSSNTIATQRSITDADARGPRTPTTSTAAPHGFLAPVRAKSSTRPNSNDRLPTSCRRCRAMAWCGV